MPAASFLEKGFLTNSGGWSSGATPVSAGGRLQVDMEMVDLIFTKLRELYAGSTDKKDEPLLKATWDYDKTSQVTFAEDVLREINGYNLVTGELLKESVN